MKETVTTTWQILFPGPLSPWLVLLLALLALAGTAWLLRRELRRRRTRGVARWLYVLRALVVVLVALLLAQPELFLRRVVARSAPLLVETDTSASMGRSDAWNGTELFDLALAAGEQFTGRETRPLAAAILLDSAGQRLHQSAAAIRQLHEQLAQGLPWGESLSTVLQVESAYAIAWHKQVKTQATALTQLELLMRQDNPLAGEQKTVRPPLPPFEPEAFAAVDGALAAADLLTTDLPSAPDQALSQAQVADLLRRFQKAAESAAAAAVAVRRLQGKCDAVYWERLAPARREQLAAVAKAPRRELVERALTQLAAQHPEFPLERTGDAASAAAPLLPATDLYTGLDRLLHGDLATRQVSGILLLSDGAQNLPERPELLRHLRQRGVPLFTVGVGREESGADVAIVDYRTPGMVQARREFSLSVQLKTAVAKDTPIDLTLRADTEIVARRTLQADGQPETTVTLSIRAPAEEVELWTLAARTPDSDAAPDNDVVSFQMRVVRREERVLVVAPAPHWDIVYLMRALQRLPVRVDTVWWDGLKPGEAVERGSGNGRLPDTASRLERYTLVVLDGPPFPGMTAEDLALFRDYLAAGGNLLLTRNVKGESYFERFGDAAGGAAGPQPLLPATSPPLPAVTASADPSRTLSLWRQMAVPQSVATAPAGDVPLLASADAGPCFTLAFSGRGKLYRLGVSDLFRLREWENGPSVNRFLAALAVDLLSPLFAPDSTVPALYPPLPFPGGDAWIVIPAGLPAGWSLLAAEPETVLAALPAATPDRTTVLRVSLPRVARLQWRGPTGTQDLPLARTVAAEALVLGLDAGRLERMAKAADGAYLPLVRLAELPARVSLKTDRQVTFRQLRLWNLPAILILLALLFTTDWVLRRRAGLVL